MEWERAQLVGEQARLSKLQPDLIDDAFIIIREQTAQWALTLENCRNPLAIRLAGMHGEIKTAKTEQAIERIVTLYITPVLSSWWIAANDESWT